MRRRQRLIGNENVNTVIYVCELLNNCCQLIPNQVLNSKHTHYMFKLILSLLQSYKVI